MTVQTAEIRYEIRGQRHSYPLAKDEVTIGRSPDNDLVIQDASISRHHAKIQRAHEGWRLVDLGSKNGTEVNGQTADQVPLRDGDEIILGKFLLTFAGDKSGIVALTSQTPSVVDDSSGTVVRSAVDFAQLANAGDASAARGGEVDRLRRLLAIVAEVSKTLVSSKPLDEVLGKFLDIVFEHLPVERACVMLWDDKRQDLVSRVVKARGSKDGEAPSLEISRTIAEKVYRGKVSVLTTDAQHDPRFAGGASILALGIRSAMAAPLWNNDTVDGIIYVDTPLHVKAFDDFDLDLLSALGNHCAVAIEQSRLQDSVFRERLSRQRLERYHSPAVVERITSGGAEGVLSADEREVTVLFADVVGFTSRCEGMDPREVAQLLNRYFSVMADMVFRHEGMLDKFIGDCLMAVFGAPLPMADHSRRAVQAALDMRDALDELNRQVPESERVQFRVGMNSGRVIAGDIGSLRRSDYTVLGATVNLAARLESSVAKPGQILISDATYDAVKRDFRTRFVTESQPKGISRVVKCYEVLGSLSDPTLTG